MSEFSCTVSSETKNGILRARNNLCYSENVESGSKTIHLRRRGQATRGANACQRPVAHSVSARQNHTKTSDIARSLNFATINEFSLLSSFSRGSI
jgi:hypothetical protein